MPGVNFNLRLLRKLKLTPGTLLLIAACGPREPLALRGETMGTTYEVKLAGTPPPDPAALKADIDALLGRINGLMSTYDPDSELSRFNASRSTGPYPVSAETARVVSAALAFARETGGAFDPTVGPLVDLWGFGPAGRRREPPAPAEARRARRLVGWRNVRLFDDPPRLRKSIPGLRLDLSAVAKGYAVDAVAGLLSERGLADFMVEIGGEVVARGSNARGEPWRIGVASPREDGRPFARVVPISGRALATSGDYRNYFGHGDRRYAHVLDPRAGEPVRTGVASASAAAPTCLEADAAATALMVLGAEKGLAWIGGKAGYEAFLIVEKGGVLEERSTSGFPAPL